MPEPMRDVWTAGEPYELFMGRWSRSVAATFLTWLDIPPGQIWADVGCGTGALTAGILATAMPQAVGAIDRSVGFLNTARNTIADSRAQFAVADATALPWKRGACTVVVAGLALNFVANPLDAVREMVRVTRPEGKVVVYIWDYQDGMEMLRRFWDAAITVDPAAIALNEATRCPLCQPDPLAELFAAAGLTAVSVRAIVIPMAFETFDAYWNPFLGRQGSAPAYVASLNAATREQLRQALQARLETADDGSITLAAWAWAIQGIV